MALKDLAINITGNNDGANQAILKTQALISAFQKFVDKNTGDISNKVSDSTKKSSKSVKDFDDSVSKSSKNIKESTNQITNSFGVMSVAIGNIISNIAQSLVGGFFDGIKGAIALGSQLEQTRISFDVLLGSAEKAEEFLIQLKEFAFKTPFDLPGLQESSKRLLAWGFAQEEIIPTLETLGNISAGVGKEKLPLLILALGQVKAQTTLTGAEMRQFSENGVPLLDTLAKQFGVTTAKMKDMVSESKVTYDDVRKALDSLATGTGRFAGLMEKQSATLGGVFSNIKERLQSFTYAILGMSETGTIIQGSFFDVLKNGFVDVYNFLARNSGVINGTLANISSAAGTFASYFIMVFGGIANALQPIIMRIYDLLTYLNPFQHHSPSIAEKVDEGVDFIINKYKKLDEVVYANEELKTSHEELVAEIGKTEEKLATLEQTITDEKTALDKAKISIDEKKEALSKLKDESKNLSTELSNVRDKLNDLKNVKLEGETGISDELFAIDQQLLAIKKEKLSVDTSESDKKISDLNSELKVLENQKLQLGISTGNTQNIDDLANQIKNLQSQRLNLKLSDSKGNASQISQLTLKIEELTAKKKDLTDIDSESKKDLNDQISLIKNQISDQEDLAKSLTSELEKKEDLLNTQKDLIETQAKIDYDPQKRGIQKLFDLEPEKKFEDVKNEVGKLRIEETKLVKDLAKNETAQSDLNTELLTAQNLYDDQNKSLSEQEKLLKGVNEQLNSQKNKLQELKSINDKVVQSEKAKSAGGGGGGGGGGGFDLAPMPEAKGGLVDDVSKKADDIKKKVFDNQLVLGFIEGFNTFFTTINNGITIIQKLIDMIGIYLPKAFQMAQPYIQPLLDRIQPLTDLLSKLWNKATEGIEPLRLLGVFLGVFASTLASGAAMSLFIAGLTIVGTYLAGFIASLSLVQIVLVGLYTAWQTNMFGIQQIATDVFENYIKPAFFWLVEYIKSDVIPKLTDLYNYFVANILPKIQEFANYVKDEVVPKLIEWGRIIGENVIGKLTELYNYFVANILPKLVEFYNYIKDNVIPKLQDFGNDLKTYVIDNLKKLYDNFVEDIMPELKKFYDMMKDNLQPTTKTLGETVEKLAGYYKTLYDILEPLVKFTLSKLWDLLKWITPILIDWETKILKNVLKGITDLTDLGFDVLNVALKKTNDFLDWITDKLKKIPELASKVSDQLSKIKAPVSSGFGGLVGMVTGSGDTGGKVGINKLESYDTGLLPTGQKGKYGQNEYLARIHEGEIILNPKIPEQKDMIDRAFGVDEQNFSFVGQFADVWDSVKMQTETTWDNIVEKVKTSVGDIVETISNSDIAKSIKGTFQGLSESDKKFMNPDLQGGSFNEVRNMQWLRDANKKLGGPESIDTFQESVKNLADSLGYATDNGLKKSNDKRYDPLAISNAGWQDSMRNMLQNSANNIQKLNVGLPENLSAQSSVTLQVGTLVADQNGLLELERTLGNLRISEQNRKLQTI